MTYKVPLPFTKYACCTCEWVLCGNLCKHKVAIFLTCTDLTKKNIIQYCGTWYGSNRGSFVAMIADLTYLHIYDNESDDEEADEDHFEKPWVDMCELMSGLYLPQCGKTERSQPTLNFIHLHGKNACSNG